MDRDPGLLIRARAAWRLVRDAPREGRARADALAAEARAAGDAPALAAALRARGWAERELLDLRAARATLGEAARAARRAGGGPPLAAILAARAAVQLELGRAGEARRDIGRARAALGGEASADVDLQAAIIEDAAGHLLTAADLYRAVIASREDLEPDAAFIATNNLGMILGQVGDLAAGQEMLERAERVAEGLGRSTVGVAVHNRAMLAARAGRLAAALAAFDRAEAIFREIDQPLAEHLMERVEALAALHLLDEAREAADRAVEELRSAGGGLLLGEAELARARVLLAAGAHDDAEEAAAAARSLLRAARGPLWRAQADLVAAEARLRAGRPAAGDATAVAGAAARLERAGFAVEATDARLLAGRLSLRRGRRRAAAAQLSPVAARGRDPIALVRLRARLAQALLAEAAGDAAGVRRAARRGLDDLEGLRRALPSAELRALASGHGVELASMGLASALRGGRAAAVLSWMERGRQASALTAGPEPRGGEVGEALARLRQITAPHPDGDGAAEAGPGARERAALEALVARRVRAAASGAAPAARRADARRLAAALGSRVLVELAACDGRLRAVAVGGGRAASIHRLGDAVEVRGEAEALLFGLRRLATARPGPFREAAAAAVAHALGRLDAALLEPVADRLGAAAGVVVVPTADLLVVPWHALATLEGRAVTVAPSATGWWRAQAAASPDGAPIVAAGPGLDGAAEEATRVGARHPGARVLLPPRSTVAEVAAAMAGSRLVHLACHGRLRADNPSFSSLVLSDGPLTVLDLEGIGRPPGVVVLAACDSGVGRVYAGEELRGFVSALFGLGARSVIASAIPIPDLDSVELMSELHEGLAEGLPPVTALSRARREVGTDTPGRRVAGIAFAHYGAF
ncbi:MAG: CHAT domain-containing protein [Thermoleophilia bacterium]